MRRAACTLLLLAALLCGCGGEDDATGDAPPPTPAAALQQQPKAAGEIVVSGETSPASHGPYELSGTYVARFEQQAPEDPDLDFTTQTPFVARLDPHADSDDAGGTVALFDDAARTGEATIEAEGRLYLDVEFGDFPYAIRLTPKR